MNKLKPLRFKDIAVDMTAMCDVAMLLLCFLLLTGRFKQWEPMKINMPVAAKSIYEPNDNVAIIHLAANKAMFQILNDNVRQQTLLAIGRKYHVKFSANEQREFLNSPIIGAPVCQLKQYNSEYMDWTSRVNRPGIPYNGQDSELSDWIHESRRAQQFFNNHSLNIIIKADKDVGYPFLKRIIAILQNQQVNKFSLLVASNNRDI